MITASHATLSPMYALPSMRPALPRHTSTSTSMRNWSPGLTGRRNLARSMPVNSNSLCSRCFVDLRDLVASLAAVTCPEWTASAFALIESRLGPNPRHTEVDSWELTGTD